MLVVTNNIYISFYVMYNIQKINKISTKYQDYES